MKTNKTQIYFIIAILSTHFRSWCWCLYFVWASSLNHWNLLLSRNVYQVIILIIGPSIVCALKFFEFFKRFSSLPFSVKRQIVVTCIVIGFCFLMFHSLRHRNQSFYMPFYDSTLHCILYIYSFFPISEIRRPYDTTI